MISPSNRGISRIWLFAALALAFVSPPEVAAQDAPRVEPDQIVIDAEASKMSFSMFGSDVGLFREIRFVNEDEGSKIDGIIVAMGRARGERRNASVRTSGATPGIYFVELVDSRGNAVTLDLEVIVEGDEEVEELSAPEVSVDLIEIPAEAGRVSFSMFGPNVGLFSEIQVVPDNDRSGTEGIRIAMGRGRGEKRNASIRTGGATPGLYFVELLDGQGDAVTLDLEVIVGGEEEIEVEEPSEVDEGEQQAAEFDSAPDGPVVVQILGMDDPLPVTDVDLGGIDIEVEDATQGDHADSREYAYGAAEYRDMTLTFPSLVQPLLDWANEASMMGGAGAAVHRDIVFTFGDRKGAPGVQYNANGCVPVSVSIDDNMSNQFSLTLRPQWVESTMSSDIGPGEFTLEPAADGGGQFEIEIDVDGRNVKLGSARFTGGELVVEEIEASSGSSQYSESTMGHSSVNELIIEVPSGLDEGILSELMHRVANQGQDQSAEIGIVARAAGTGP